MEKMRKTRTGAPGNENEGWLSTRDRKKISSSSGKTPGGRYCVRKRPVPRTPLVMLMDDVPCQQKAPTKQTTIADFFGLRLQPLPPLPARDDPQTSTATNLPAVPTLADDGGSTRKDEAGGSGDFFDYADFEMPPPTPSQSQQQATSSSSCCALSMSVDAETEQCKTGSVSSSSSYEIIGVNGQPLAGNIPSPSLREQTTLPSSPPSKIPGVVSLGSTALNLEVQTTLHSPLTSKMTGVSTLASNKDKVRRELRAESDVAHDVDSSTKVREMFHESMADTQDLFDSLHTPAFLKGVKHGLDSEADVDYVETADPETGHSHSPTQVKLLIPKRSRLSVNGKRQVSMHEQENVSLGTQNRCRGLWNEDSERFDSKSGRRSTKKDVDSEEVNVFLSYPLCNEHSSLDLTQKVKNVHLADSQESMMVESSTQLLCVKLKSSLEDNLNSCSSSFNIKSNDPMLNCCSIRLDCQHPAAERNSEGTGLKPTRSIKSEGPSVEKRSFQEPPFNSFPSSGVDSLESAETASSDSLMTPDFDGCQNEATLYTPVFSTHSANVGNFNSQTFSGSVAHGAENEKCGGDVSFSCTQSPQPFGSTGKPSRRSVAKAQRSRILQRPQAPQSLPSDTDLQTPAFLKDISDDPDAADLSFE